MNTTALSVNLNKVALVRNTRHLGIPSLTRAAEICLRSGANGITVHPRPDQRHIRPQDVRIMATAALSRHAPADSGLTVARERLESSQTQSEALMLQLGRQLDLAGPVR